MQQGCPRDERPPVEGGHNPTCCPGRPTASSFAKQPCGPAARRLGQRSTHSRAFWRARHAPTFRPPAGSAAASRLYESAAPPATLVEATLPMHKGGAACRSSPIIRSAVTRTLAQPARAGKHYSLFAVLDHRGRPVEQTRVNHEPGAIRAFVSRFPPGTPVALETVGNWYWIVDEIEQAGCVPLLAHAQMAKKMMGHVHKTDKLDAQGLAILQHPGSLPTVWIAPGEIRDERELPRTRMALSKVRTMLTSSRCPSGRTACIPPWPHLPSRQDIPKEHRDGAGTVWRAVPGSTRSPSTLRAISTLPNGARSSCSSSALCPTKPGAACSRSSNCWIRCRSRSVGWRLASWNGCR